MNVQDYVCTGPCMIRVFVEIGNPLEAQLLDREEWKVGFPCISPLCHGRLVRGSRVGAKEPIHLTATEFYRRVSGQGKATYADFNRIFRTKRPVSVEAMPYGNPEHVIVHNIVFDDGTVMHFGISRHGACVYKIEEPDHGVHAEPVAEGSYPHREEVGRDPDSAATPGQDAGSGGADHAPTLDQPQPEPVPAMSETGHVPTSRASESGEGDRPNLRM